MPEVEPRKTSAFSRGLYLSVAFLAGIFLLVLAYLVIFLWLGGRKPPAGILHLTPLKQSSPQD
ncbi:MAG: hypothetical protein Q8N84_02535 [bacterium]|nr:hypothetical protein [bacterium]